MFQHVGGNSVVKDPILIIPRILAYQSRANNDEYVKGLTARVCPASKVRRVIRFFGNFFALPFSPLPPATNAETCAIWDAAGLVPRFSVVDDRHSFQADCSLRAGENRVFNFCFLSPCDRRWDVTCGDDVWFKCWGPDLLTMWDFKCAFSANFCHFFTGGSRGDSYYYWESSESSRTLQRPLYHIWSNEVSEAGFGINVAVWICH